MSSWLSVDSIAIGFLVKCVCAALNPVDRNIKFIYIRLQPAFGCDVKTFYGNVSLLKCVGMETGGEMRIFLEPCACLNCHLCMSKYWQ